jgi:hypothetical protein
MFKLLNLEPKCFIIFSDIKPKDNMTVRKPFRDKLLSRISRNGFLLIRAIDFGAFETRGLKRVPRPPAKTMASIKELF